jgi:hypothetical protein
LFIQLVDDIKYHYKNQSYKETNKNIISSTQSVNGYGQSSKVVKPPNQSLKFSYVTVTCIFQEKQRKTEGVKVEKQFLPV